MESTSEDAVKNTLNTLVSMTEMSSNLRNELKEDILKAASSLRNDLLI
jgi:hypothetical protein